MKDSNLKVNGLSQGLPPSIYNMVRFDRYRVLANKFLRIGKLVQAQRCMEKASFISIRMFGTEHLNTARSLEDLASVLYQSQKFDTSKCMYDRAFRIKRKFEQ